VIRAHHRAVLTLLGDAVTVYVSRAANDATMPYVVLHPDQGQADTTSYEGRSDWRSWRYTTTCVGSTPEQAGWAAERVEANLLDIRPAVAGRTCTPIRKEAPIPVDRDEDVQPPVYIARDVWVFSSVPA
jgi:hypothetical protein